jgi:transposase
MPILIRGSIHTTRFANKGKLDHLHDFLIEYTRVTWLLVDYLWSTSISWDENHIFSIKDNLFDAPKFMSINKLDVDTTLSARALRSASNQALGIVTSVTNKRKKQLYKLDLLIKAGDIAKANKLQDTINEQPLTKPTSAGKLIHPNLDSNCCEFIDIAGPYCEYKTQKEVIDKETGEITTSWKVIQTKIINPQFNGFLRLHCLGKSFGRIYIPIKYTKHTNKLINKGYKRKTSWIIGKDSVSSLWDYEPIHTTGKLIVGADQGAKTCLTLSDGQTTKINKHGYDLDSIMKKLSRRKKGSNGFKRAQDERTNYINWSINQLDISNIKELRLEKLFDMRRGCNSGRFLGHWTYTAINKKIINRCQEEGVPIKEQSPTYRSQRCSKCGWTHKPNRKKKEFKCTSCGHSLDADLNGACNHEIELFPLPVGLWRSKLNRSGFFWKEDGMFDVVGQEIAVPDVYVNQ